MFATFSVEEHTNETRDNGNVGLDAGRDYDFGDHLTPAEGEWVGENEAGNDTEDDMMEDGAYASDDSDRFGGG